jgi:CheY-like chemotaxis protein
MAMLESTPLHDDDGPYPWILAPTESSAEGVSARVPVRGRVLVVDDEPLVRALMVGVLGTLGHWVTAFEDPIVAVEAVRAAPYDYDLVLADQTMPGVSGLGLAGLIHEVRPDLPVILATGCVELVNREAMAAAGIRGVLLKPFHRRELAEAVERVLSEGAREPEEPRDEARQAGGPHHPAA